MNAIRQIILTSTLSSWQPLIIIRPIKCNHVLTSNNLDPTFTICRQPGFSSNSIRPSFSKSCRCISLITLQDRFFVDRVPMRVYKNANYTNNFFPNEKPMYLFSSIWNADDWATRGGLEKTDWEKAPFVSSYKDFTADGCQWEDPFPACVSTTTDNWWDQYNAWHLSDDNKKDYSWVQRNLVIYDYCKDTERYPTLPEECWLSPWD